MGIVGHDLKRVRGGHRTCFELDTDSIVCLCVCVLSLNEDCENCYLRAREAC